MLGNDEQRIQISRSKYIEESRAIAVLRLNEKEFLKGEVCMLNYYKDSDIRTDVGVLVAIGIKNGVGEDCYRILSVGGTVPVRNVVQSLADVSSLVHGEIYIYHDVEDTGDWFYVYLKEGEVNRTIEKITGGPYIFVDLESGYRWFYEDQGCKREDDFFTKEVTSEILSIFVDTKINVSVETTNGWIFKTGHVKDVILRIQATDIKGNVVNDKCTFYIDQELIDLVNREYILKNQAEDRDITVEARYDIGSGVSIPFFGTTYIRFGYDFYYGRIPSANWAITKENVEKLENIELNFKRDLVWDSEGLELNRVAMAYPKKYGYLLHIFDVHGLDYIHSYQVYDAGFGFDGEDYLVYVLKKPVSIDELRQKYVFTDDETEILLNNSGLSDIFRAWEQKNSTGGLVLLNEDGKIPEELYNLNASSAFRKIIGMVNEFPTSGMTVGDSYYNSDTNELFTAISDSDGVISYPLNDTIYAYDNEFYSLIGNKLQPFGRVRARKINNIEEIYG